MTSNTLLLSLALARAAMAAIPGRSLADCQAFALNFDNTCPTVSNVTQEMDLANDSGLTVSCTGVMRCPGTSGEATYTSSNPCTYERKLCVSCYEDNSTTYIKVQANGLPNHCFHSVVNVSSAMEHEWTAVFNADVSGLENYTSSDFDTSAKTDEILCDIQRTAESNMNAWSDYTLISRRRRELQPPNGGSGNGPPPNGGGSSGGSSGSSSSSGGSSSMALQTSAGIMITGGYMYNALAAGNADAVLTEADTLDVCYDHPSPQSEFHYHYSGPCMRKDLGYWNDQEAPALCRDTSGCVDDPENFTLTGAASGNSVTYEASTWDTPIGLARDGHIIIGPYKSDGTTWDCADRDVCNGAFVDGSYVYVGSSTFPYVVGCWGPGPAHVYQPGCSTNSCGSQASDSSSSSSSSSSTSSSDTSSSDTYGVEGSVELTFAVGSTILSLLSMF